MKFEKCKCVSIRSFMVRKMVILAVRVSLRSIIIFNSQKLNINSPLYEMITICSAAQSSLPKVLFRNKNTDYECTMIMFVWRDNVRH